MARYNEAREVGQRSKSRIIGCKHQIETLSLFLAYVSVKTCTNTAITYQKLDMVRKYVRCQVLTLLC